MMLIIYWSMQIYVTLFHTGQEDYDRLRPLSYNGAHAIIICYDVTNPISFNNILTKVTRPTVRQHNM